MKFTNTNNETIEAGQFDNTPLEPGWYDVTIFDAEMVEFSKKPGYEGKNEGLNVQYRISESQTGTNRRFFQRVYLGDTKFPSGANNFGLFDFGDAVTGGGFRKAYNSGEAEMPDIEQLLGMPLQIRLATEEYNGEKRSAVKSVRAPKPSSKGGAVATAKATVAQQEEIDL